MNTQIAVLCDAATDYSGKLNLLGTFDTLVVRQLPAMHPQCSLALRLLFDRGEEGQHHLKLNLVDADGRPIMQPIEIRFEVTIPADALQLSRNFVVNIQQLKFAQVGHYAVAVLVDGQLIASIPLLVKLAGKEA